jgi:hypothetical protein
MEASVGTPGASFGLCWHLWQSCGFETGIEDTMLTKTKKINESMMKYCSCVIVFFLRVSGAS